MRNLAAGLQAVFQLIGITVVVFAMMGAFHIGNFYLYYGPKDPAHCLLHPVQQP